MKCSKCHCILSPNEKDFVIECLINGEKIDPICDDCVELSYLPDDYEFIEYDL